MEECFSFFWHRAPVQASNSQIICSNLTTSNFSSFIFYFAIFFLSKKQCLSETARVGDWYGQLGVLLLFVMEGQKLLVEP